MAWLVCGLLALAFQAASDRFTQFDHPRGGYSLQYPSNWNASAAGSDHGATFWPLGGVVNRNQVQSVDCGVVVNDYVPPPSDGPLTLEQATQALVSFMRDRDVTLREVPGSLKKLEIDGEPAVRLSLTGESLATHEPQRMTLTTRRVDEGRVLYLLAIAPARAAPELAPTFERMVESLNVHPLSNRL